MEEEVQNKMLVYLQIDKSSYLEIYLLEEI